MRRIGNLAGLGGFILGAYVWHSMDDSELALQWGVAAVALVLGTTWLNRLLRGQLPTVASLIFDLGASSIVFVFVGGCAAVVDLHDRTEDVGAWLLLPFVFAAAGGLVWVFHRFMGDRFPGISRFRDNPTVRRR